MDTRTILSELCSERERLDKAIAALESLGGVGTATATLRRQPAIGSKVAPKRGRRPMSASARKRLSEMMKKRWAARRRAKQS